MKKCVFGAVRSPGTIEMSSAMPLTLVAAIANAGGFSDNANKSKIQIKRKAADGNEEIIKANLKDILKGEAEDIPLQPGDVISVPESFF